jgi:hypothetical protein
MPIDKVPTPADLGWLTSEELERVNDSLHNVSHALRAAPKNTSVRCGIHPGHARQTLAVCEAIRAAGWSCGVIDENTCAPRRRDLGEGEGEVAVTDDEEVKAGDIYEHCRTKHRYVVVEITRDTEDDTALKYGDGRRVVYRRVDGTPGTWDRPYAMFVETVDTPDGDVPRFRKVVTVSHGRRGTRRLARRR